LGSNVGLTDSSANLVEQLTYDSFGNHTASGRTRYTYTGRERDVDTGLMYYRARFYDPQVGRFINEDPIGLNGGINHYAYVGNNPASFIDPSGLCPQKTHMEPCSAIVHLDGADTGQGALERLLYQEATAHAKSSDYSSKDALDEMGAIAGSVLNRVAFLGTPGLTQGQTMGFGNPGASIADVVYSRGNNPYRNKRTGKITPIATQYAGFTADGIDPDIQTRINNALNSDIGSADCTKLHNAYLIGQLGMDARLLDPYNGQTMGMRTAGSTSLVHHSFSSLTRFPAPRTFSLV
jgi:RHS repeat-associated protein